MSLTVLQAGLHSRVVDAGRPRSRRLGVPVGGAFDLAAFRLGNALLNNHPDTPALEITLLGPTLRARDDVGAVIFGAPFECRLGNERLRPGRPFRIVKGQTLHVGPTANGSRGYLCVTGGFDTPAVLDSCSAFTPINDGDELPCGDGETPMRFFPSVRSRKLIEPGVEPGVIRVIAGPQSDRFEAGNLTGGRFRVTPNSDRMGVRLDGKPLRTEGGEMLSEPVGPGTVQVTHSGQCIVLGPDAQTVGGYPKVAHVIRADRDALAQLRPGDEIRFAEVSPDEAEAAGREYDRHLREWLTRARLTAGTLGSG